MLRIYYPRTKLPAKGFKVASVREEAYEVAEKIANEENRSVADVVSRAVMDYGDTRKHLQSKMRQLIQLVETLPSE